MGFSLRKLQGPALQRMIAVVGSVAFLLQGYNQSMMNGLLTMGEFLQVIPQVDTLNTAGAQAAKNAKIQGEDHDHDTFYIETRSPTNAVQGLVVAIYELGSAIGALPCLAIGDRLG